MAQSRNFKLITDTHFGHDSITRNGYRKHDFESTIILNNAKAESGSIMIHLGDVAFSDDKYWHTKFLQSCSHMHSTILVLGNHDKRTLSWYYDRGWSFVCYSFALSIYGVHIVFTHKPLDSVDEHVDINIHGHLHNGTHRPHTPETFHELISIEDTLSPISLKDVVQRHMLIQT